MNHKSLFFKYVIPSIIAFALSGIYAIVDGYFVGNTIGDAGLSAINIAYPIEALIQALGTGIGMEELFITQLMQQKRKENGQKNLLLQAGGFL